MIISFSVFKDKIESGEKKQTIRKYSEKRFKQFCNAKKYQLYWGNPRNGGTKIKEVDPDGEPTIIQFWNYTTGFEELHDEVAVNIVLQNGNQKEVLDRHSFAKNDGFNNFYDMESWFYEHYGETMFKQRFMVIRWK